MKRRKKPDQKLVCHQFKFYANAPNMSAQAWPGYIRKMEEECGHKISHDEAKRIFKILQNTSKAAKQNYRDAKDAACSSDALKKIRKGQFIVYDRKTGLWRGRLTPPKRESIGLDRNGARGEQSQDSLRSRHGDIPVMERQSFLEEIKRRETEAGYQCDNERAVSILKIGNANEFFEFHRGTLTWRGYLQPEPSEEATRIRRIELAEKQKTYWWLFANMPELDHNWKEPDQSPAIRWTMGHVCGSGYSTTVTVITSAYHAAWNCSENKTLVPLRKNRTNGKVYGFNTLLSQTFGAMPALTRNSFSEASDLTRWLTENVREDDPLGCLEIAIATGHALDLGNGQYIGGDTEARLEAERQEAAKAAELARIAKEQAEKERALVEKARREESERRREQERIDETKYRELTWGGLSHWFTHGKMPAHENDSDLHAILRQDYGVSLDCARKILIEARRRWGMHLRE